MERGSWSQSSEGVSLHVWAVPPGPGLIGAGVASLRERFQDQRIGVRQRPSQLRSSAPKDRSDERRASETDPITTQPRD